MTGEQRRNTQRRSSNPRSRQNASYEQSEFINIELGKDEIAAQRLWREDLEHVLELWTELVEGGYRINTKYDDYSSSCAAFIIPGDGSDNAGYILTGRGGTPYRALTEALYKHEILLRGEWARAFAARNVADDPDF